MIIVQVVTWSLSDHCPSQVQHSMRNGGYSLRIEASINPQLQPSCHGVGRKDYCQLRPWRWVKNFRMRRTLLLYFAFAPSLLFLTSKWHPKVGVFESSGETPSSRSRNLPSSARDKQPLSGLQTLLAADWSPVWLGWVTMLCCSQPRTLAISFELWHHHMPLPN